MRQRRPQTDWFLLLALVALWGTAFLFIKVAVGSIAPATLVAMRVSVAAIVLTVVVRVRGERLPSSPKIWTHYLLMGVVGNALPFTLISWGQVKVDSGLTGILMGVMPLMTLLLAHFFVPGERMTPRMVVGFGVAFLGLLVLFEPAALGEVRGGASQLSRQLAILAGATCYAINTIIARRLAVLNSLVSSATVMWTASAIMLPVALSIDQPWNLEPSTGALTSAIWLGLFPTAFATLIYFRLIQTAGPTFVSMMNYMIPVVALIAGMVVLDEELAWPAVAGLAVILTGLAISQRGIRSS